MVPERTLLGLSDASCSMMESHDTLLMPDVKVEVNAVSYTHLTLPTSDGV